LTPKPTHYAVVRTLLEAGVDVFCEKPLTTVLAEAEALVALAARTGRILMVGFNRRFAPVYVTAREAFATRPPEACLAMKNRPGTEYRATFENAVHMVDLLRWFCGEALEVHGRAAFADPYRETTAVATLSFDSGALAVLLANRSTSHWVERLEVFGHGRSAVVEAPDRVSLGQDGEARVTEMTPRHMGWAHVADKMGFRQELEHFVECVRTRAEPRTSGADAVRTQALMDRLLQAMGLPVQDRAGG
jgi:virulence factor